MDARCKHFACGLMQAHSTIEIVKNVECASAIIVIFEDTAAIVGQFGENGML